jgi:hypothetical protein
VFRNIMILAGPFRNYDFAGNKIWDGLLASFQGQFINYWDFNLMCAYNPRSISNNLTRGGPLAERLAGYQIDLSLSTDGRKAVVLEWEGSVYRTPGDGQEFTGGMEVRWKPGTNFNLSIEPQYSTYSSQIQWVTKAADPTMTATYGSRYVFGRIDEKMLSSEIRLNWIFDPRLSLQVYLQPYIAVGKYDRFKELARAKSYAYNVYGDGNSTVGSADGIYTVDPDGPDGPAAAFAFGNPDFNMKSLRGTIVLRWEYRPGSLVYLVWTQNRADYANPGDFQFHRDFRDLMNAPGDNIFLVKFSYRWNM